MSAATTNLSRTERDVPSMIPATSNGGPVKKLTHEQLLARFMNLVEKAKTAEKERTKPLLSVPDDVIANALAATQRVLR